MNLAIRGIDANLGGKQADSFHHDLHKDLKADFVLANPPFNDSDWGGDRLREDARWKFGTPPTGNANYAWIQHFIHHLSPTGIAGWVMANGSMSSNQSGEGEIRKSNLMSMGSVAQVGLVRRVPSSPAHAPRNDARRGRAGRRRSPPIRAGRLTSPTRALKFRRELHQGASQCEVSPVRGEHERPHGQHAYGTFSGAETGTANRRIGCLLRYRVPKLLGDSMSEMMPRIANWFDFPAVQREMIEDDLRISRYAAAIDAVVQPGDVVVDLGTGTGILAFLALRAGARKVYAIERRAIVEVARENAFRNRMADRIQFINADSRFVNLPERVDCLISEVIGHFALEENMLDAISDARARFLKATGKMIPVSVDLFFAPTSAANVYDREIRAWENPIAGFDMSAGRELAANNSYIDTLSSGDLLADPLLVAHVELEHTTNTGVQARADFTIRRAHTMTGVAAWFRVELSPGIQIDSSPDAPRTHWQQCFFPVREPCPVTLGEVVTLEFCSRSLLDDVVYSWNVSVWPNEDADVPRAEFAHSTSRHLNTDALQKFWTVARRRGSCRPKQMLARRATG